METLLDASTLESIAHYLRISVWSVCNKIPRVMSPQPKSDQSTSSKPAATGGQPTTGRILACALCKQRRVKCTRSFPCENCVRAGVQCVQPTVQQRRRRFAERALLDRIQAYECLLRKNNIPFEPLHGYQSGSVPAPVSLQDGDPDPCYSRRSRENEARDVWLSIKRVVNIPSPYHWSWLGD